MNRKLALRALVVFGLSVGPATTRAVVLYDQPLTSWGNGWCSPCSGNQFNYDFRTFGSFSLASNSTLQSARFAIHDTSLGNDDLHISVWDTPFGTELYSLNAPAGSYTKVLNPNGDLYYADVDLPNWPLAAGSHWISLFGTNGNTLGWGTDQSVGDDYQYSFPADLLGTDRYVGFTLFGTVPEPTGIALLGLGMAGVFVARRARK